MDNKQVINIAHNLMYELNIEEQFQSIIEGPVHQHWPWHGVIYKFLCNIVSGSMVVEKNKNYYVENGMKRDVEWSWTK